MEMICYASFSHRQVYKKIIHCFLVTLMVPTCSLLYFPIDPPTAPGTLSVSFTIPGQQFIITWNEPPLNVGERVDTYFVDISGPDDLCGNVNILQRFGVSTRNYTCSGWTMPPAGHTYTFTVQAANCGGDLRGLESDPTR